MEDPREKFLSDIEFDKIHLERYPKLIFLCGGTLGLRDDHGLKHHPSLRSYIGQRIDDNKSSLQYRYAEEITDWNSYRQYEDLVEFEKDIAHICRIIVLIVESAGSIAELGSFCMIPEVKNKLLIFFAL